MFNAVILPLLPEGATKALAVLVMMARIVIVVNFMVLSNISS
jgi:hypothetical protein